LQRVPSFGTNRCGIVAGKLIAISAPIHLACLLREFLLTGNQEQNRQQASLLSAKRLPDRPEPWASGVRQANHLYLLPISYVHAPHSYFEYEAPGECVSAEHFLNRQSSLLTSRARIIVVHEVSPD
jgi:hypothetical protein